MRVSAKDARAMGLTPAKRRTKSTRGPSALAAVFLEGCRQHGLSTPIAEFQFDPPRKWRFDFCWITWVALEIQGGIFTGGRHVRGAALLNEYEKLNRAAVLGWHVLFATPADIESGAIYGLLKEIL